MAGPPTEASPEKNEALCPDSYGSSEILLWSAASSCLVERKKKKTQQGLMSQYSVELLARLQIRFSGVFLTALCSLAMQSSCKALLVSCLPQSYSCFALLNWCRAARACLFGVCTQLFQQGDSPDTHTLGNACRSLDGIWRKYIGE